MVDKTVVRNVANLGVSIILLIAYFHLFGAQSFRKYIDNEIIITEQEEKFSYVAWASEPPPGKMAKLFHLQYTPKLQP